MDKEIVNAKHGSGNSGRWTYAAAVILVWLIFPILIQAGDVKIPLNAIHRQIFDSCIWANSAPVSILVADRGKIYRQGPQDDGLWRPVESGVQEPLFSVHMVDKRYGWISGASGTILRTDDGGMHWKIQNSATEKHLFSIHFADAFNGCAVGDWGTIVVTNDGGRSWQNRSWPDDVVFYGVHMFDADNGLIVGEFGKMLSTSDGGRSWIELAAPVEQSLFCLDASDQTVVAAGLDGIVLVSDDRGKNWQTVDTPVEDSLFGISMKDRSVRAVGHPGVLITSEDGGHTWTAAATANHPTLAWDRRGASLLVARQSR